MSNLDSPIDPSQIKKEGPIQVSNVMKDDFGIDDKQDHWKAIAKVAISDKGVVKTVWRNAAKIIDVFTSNDDGSSLEGISDDIKMIINELQNK